MTLSTTEYWYPVGAAEPQRLGRAAATQIVYEPLPTQSYTISYEDNPSSSLIAQHARLGGLIVAGRTNYANTSIVAAAQAGACVLLYIDVIIDASYGRYHDLIMKSSAYGPAVPSWPGPISANGTGNLNDFRPGSILHQASSTNPSWTKLEAVLELALTENPHLGGFFADDLGSRSWFPNFDWSSFGTQNQQDYRDGAILVAQTFDRVCKRHGLVFCANGTWTAGTLAANGGGYPNTAAAGLSLAPMFFIENHPAEAYATGTGWAQAAQWGDDSVTGGPAYAVVSVDNSTDFDNWLASGVAAYLAYFPSGYSTVAAWGQGRANGLPHGVRY